MIKYKEKENIDIDYIRNGVDVSKYYKRSKETHINAKKNLNLPLDKTIFVYSGRMIERKNQKEAIEGFLKSEVSKNSILLLLGDGEMLEYLKEEYKLYSNILFKGNVSNIQEYIHASDYYISSSKSEGLPNGVLEAMAVGLPVILSNIPQHLEFFEINCNIGVSYELGNIEMLAKKIEKITNEKWDNLSKEAYDTVINNLTAEVMSKNYQSLYEILIHNGV